MHATLIVDAYTTKCSRCGKGTSLTATHHDRVLSGWTTPDPDARGCGAAFVAISTQDLSVTEADLAELRPDLPAYRAGKLPGELRR
ncbi:hypothetical protein AB0L80_39435 [Streptomyces sp. NPDC052069]|uniref:hypothetical protein n=1 Tax=Streptomyces sp. NPDC052069 TaxID=3154650 RepID=UPI003444DCF0